MRGTVAKRLRREAAAITATHKENGASFGDVTTRHMYREMKQLYTRGFTTTK